VIAFLKSIWGFISGSSIYKWLAEGLLAAGAAYTAYKVIEHEGALAEREKEAEASLKTAQTAAEITSEVQKLPSGGAQKQLGEEYNRS